MKTSNASKVRRTAAGPDPKITLRVPCVECADALVVPLPIEKDAIARLADDHFWHLTVLTPSGQGTEVPITLGLLCPNCAERVYPPEVLKTAKEARERMQVS